MIRLLYIITGLFCVFFFFFNSFCNSLGKKKTCRNSSKQRSVQYFHKYEKETERLKSILESVRGVGAVALWGFCFMFKGLSYYDLLY